MFSSQKNRFRELKTYGFKICTILYDTKHDCSLWICRPLSWAINFVRFSHLFRFLFINQPSPHQGEKEGDDEDIGRQDNDIHGQADTQEVGKVVAAGAIDEHVAR